MRLLYGVQFVLMQTAMVALVLCAQTAGAQVDKILGPSRTDLARVEKWLRLDEDQAVLARQFCEDYYSQFRTDLLNRVVLINTSLPPVHQPDFERAFRENQHEILALRAEIKLRVEALLENLESILREDQIPLMARVRNGWARLRWRIPRGSSLPDGNVDVINLVDDLDLTQQEQQAVDAIMADFEPTFVAALRAKGESSIQEYKLWHEMVAIGKTLDPSDIADPQVSSPEEREYWDLYKRAGRIVLGHNLHLVSLNRGALQSFMQVLSHENATELERAYLVKAYFGIYPDAASAAALYDAVEQIDDLSIDQREATAAIRAEFERRHERASADMAKSVTRRREAHMHGTFATDLQIMVEWDTLRELGLKREALNARQLALIEPVLTPEQFATLPEWDFEENHRERPWDFNGESRRVKDQ